MANSSALSLLGNSIVFKSNLQYVFYNFTSILIISTVAIFNIATGIELFIYYIHNTYKVGHFKGKGLNALYVMKNYLKIKVNLIITIYFRDK